MEKTDGQFLVGWISPTNRPDGRETQLDDKIPSNIRVLNVTLNFTRGTEDEFRASMPAYEAKTAELAAMRANLILPSGAPPFMLLGFAGERNMIRGWEKKFDIPMFTSGQNHVRALRTLGISKFVGASYFAEKMNGVFERYFREAGFNVLTMEGIDVPFGEVPKLPSHRIVAHIKKLLERHPDAEGIYMLGSAWRTLDIIRTLEQDCGLPVVHPGPARWWETLIRLGVHHPISGYGKLLEQLPDAAPLE
jgi:maleate cis-trans isomerase